MAPPFLEIPGYFFFISSCYGCIFLYSSSNILSLGHFLYFLIKLSFFYLPSFIRLFFLYLLTSHSLIHHYICFLLPAIFSSTQLFLTTLFFSPLYPLLLSTFRLYALFIRPLFSLFLSLSHTSIFSIIPISLLLFLPPLHLHFTLTFSHHIYLDRLLHPFPTIFSPSVFSSSFSTTFMLLHHFRFLYFFYFCHH